MTAVKFCGLRSESDVDAAIRAGCDLIGLNFVPRSPRFVETDQASELVIAFGSKMLFVGVFKDPTASEVHLVLDSIALDFLQFSGEEAPDFCDSFDMPYVKGMHVTETFDFAREQERFPNAFAFLVDSSSELGGGSGKTFDWERFPRDSNAKVILAGGLNPNNVADAVRQTRPWGVDVASGIENDDYSKNRQLMVRFMQGVTNVPA